MLRSKVSASDWYAEQSARPDGVFVPVRTVNPLNNRKHWRTTWKTSGTVRGAVAAACRHRLRFLGQMVVTMTRLAPRELDDDNLAAALKPCRDGIADVLGIDDRDKRVKWIVEQERSPAGAYGIRIVARPAV